MIRRPPRSTLDRSSAASDVYKRQASGRAWWVARPPGPAPTAIEPCRGRRARAAGCLAATRQGRSSCGGFPEAALPAEDDFDACQENGAGPAGRRLVTSGRERQRQAFLLHSEAQPFGVPRHVNVAFGFLRGSDCTWARGKCRPSMETGDRLAGLLGTASTRKDARKRPVGTGRRPLGVQ